MHDGNHWSRFREGEKTFHRFHLPPGYHPHNPGQRASGPGRGSGRMLRPHAEAPEVWRTPLAPPGPDGGRGGEALREPSRGGRVEVSPGDAHAGADRRDGRSFVSSSGMTCASDTSQWTSWKSSEKTDLPSCFSTSRYVCSKPLRLKTFSDVRWCLWCLTCPDRCAATTCSIMPQRWAKGWRCSWAAWRSGE